MMTKHEMLKIVMVSSIYFRLNSPDRKKLIEEFARQYEKHPSVGPEHRDMVGSGEEKSLYILTKVTTELKNRALLKYN